MTQVTKTDRKRLEFSSEWQFLMAIGDARGLTVKVRIEQSLDECLLLPVMFVSLCNDLYASREHTVLPRFEGSKSRFLLIQPRAASLLPLGYVRPRLMLSRYADYTIAGSSGHCILRHRHDQVRPSWQKRLPMFSIWNVRKLHLAHCRQLVLIPPRECIKGQASLTSG